MKKIIIKKDINKECKDIEGYNNSEESDEEEEEGINNNKSLKNFNDSDDEEEGGSFNKKKYINNKQFYSKKGKNINENKPGKNENKSKNIIRNNNHQIDNKLKYNEYYIQYRYFNKRNNLKGDKINNINANNCKYKLYDNVDNSIT